MGDGESDRAARRLRLEAQRHAVLIASAVAHDVNNPIAFLSLASAELRRMVERATASSAPGVSPNVQLNIERLSDLVRDIEESATRLGRIVQELRIFTRGADSAHGLGGVVDLGRLIDGALTLAAGQLGGRARIESPAVDSSSQAPVSFGYALLNVLLYVGDAMSRAAEKAPFAAEVPLPVVRIESGTGGGADAASGDPALRGTLVVTVDVRSSALARFVGNESSQASGASESATPLPLALALELARDVLTDAGGGLETVASHDGHCYKLTIPVSEYVAIDGKIADAAASVPAVANAAPVAGVATARARHRVLVIDDEVALARALARGLSITCDVDVACTAADALEHLRKTRYDAIVCDLHLSERSGVALHEQVASVSSDQARRFIFTTGANAAGDSTLARAIASGCPILEKPFDGRSLDAEVARVATM